MENVSVVQSSGSLPTNRGGDKPQDSTSWTPKMKGECGNAKPRNGCQALGTDDMRTGTLLHLPARDSPLAGRSDACHSQSTKQTNKITTS